MLFQRDFVPAERMLAAFWEDKDEDPEVVEYANRIVLGTSSNLESIDEEIKASAEHWVLERMAAVDRNILRAGAYEILFVDDVPPAVAINEALEIAKKFSTKDSASFINGILDRIARKAKRLG
jgi:N utilization substance protein B